MKARNPAEHQGAASRPDYVCRRARARSPAWTGLTSVLMLIIVVFSERAPVRADIFGESAVGTIVGGEPEQSGIVFADARLDLYVRALISKRKPIQLQAADLEGIKSLNVDSLDLTSLRGIEYLKNLHTLSAVSNNVSDISSIAGLNNLRRLDLRFNRVSTIEALRSLSELNSVQLDHNRIRDIAPLVDNSGLDAGDSVALSGNPIDCAAAKDHLERLAKRRVTVSGACP